MSILNARDAVSDWMLDHDINAVRGSTNDQADSLIAALSAAGYVIVPRKPTQDMRMYAVGALAEAFKPEADRIRNLPKDEMPPAWVPISIVSGKHTDPVWEAMVNAALHPAKDET